MNIEELNYARDQRTQGPAKAPVLYFYGCGVCGVAWGSDPDGKTCDCEEFVRADMEIELPTKWGVCPVCEGKGTHVNPSIDCGGISAEEFEEDPTFKMDYLEGVYDQQCNRCGGRTTIPVIDWDAISPEQRTLYEQQLRDESDWEAERLAEIRAGC